MRKVYAILFISLLLLSAGCIYSKSKYSVKLDISVVPSKVSIESPEEISIEANVRNVGSSTITIDADVIGTELLQVKKPQRTNFTLKPEDSRTIVFTANLSKDAVPGDYVIDVRVKTDKGEVVEDRAKIRVVARRGLL